FIWPEAPAGNVYSRKIIDLNLPLYVSIKIYLSLTAGIVEEVLYRGYLYKLHSDWITGKRLADVLFVVVSSVLFSAVHSDYSAAEMASVFGFGFCASILYLSIKRLEPIIIGHFLMDMVYL